MPDNPRAAADAVDLFVYGTLRAKHLVLELTGKRFRTGHAVLPDYERVQPTEGYPYVTPRVGTEVEGLLLYEVDAASLARLDEYEDEGRLYRRQEVVVHVGEERRRCQVYMRIRHRR